MDFPGEPGKIPLAGSAVLPVEAGRIVLGKMSQMIFPILSEWEDH